MFISTTAQENSENYYISGKIKVLVGLDITIPSEITIKIEPLNRYEVTDSLGIFRFDNIKPGKYRIKIVESRYLQTDTLIELKHNSITNLNLLIKAVCDVDETIAERDINENKPRLLLRGGIAAIFYYNQHDFEKKYNISYFDFGCVGPARECIVHYNKRIFQYLDSKFGKEWRKDVRRDVLGL